MVKSKLGWEVENWLKKHPEKHTDYKKMNVAGKREFRLMFASEKGDIIDKQIDALRCLEVEESTTGQMFSAKRISVELGNDDSASLRYCKSCLMLGPTEWMIEDL